LRTILEDVGDGNGGAPGRAGLASTGAGATGAARSALSGIDAGAAGTTRPGFLRRHAHALAVLLLLAAGIAARVPLVWQDNLGHLPDTNLFVAWTRSLHEHGLAGFYAANDFCDYPPVFVLTMWGVGHAASWIDPALTDTHLLRVLLKLPATLADVGIAILLLIEGRRLLGRRAALGAAALYLLNPISLYNSAYWGQVDAIHTALVLLAIVLVARRRWAGGGAAIALALLMKFQSIAFAPLVIFEGYRQRRWRGLGALLVGGTVAGAWLCAPFALNGVLDDVLRRAYVGVVGQYNQLSPSAYNMYWALADHRTADNGVPGAVALAAAAGRASLPAGSSPLMALTWRHISLIVYSLGVALILSIYSYRPGAIARLGTAGLLGLALFLLPTEMHERYAHPAIALLALWAVTSAWRERAFFLLSALLLLNLAHILPPEDVGAHIGVALTVLFVIMLIWSGLARIQAMDGARERGTSEALCEPQPPTPALVVWFRRLTFAAVPVVLLSGVGIAVLAQRAGATAASDASVYLSTLKPVRTHQDWGVLRTDRTVRGGMIRLGDTVYLRGLGTHASSETTYDIPEGVAEFRALVGIDYDSEGKGSVFASVELDGKEVFKSPLLTAASDPVEVRVPLGDARRITLRADETPDGRRADHVDWALARFAPAGP
jgi:Gpi18-like mannosyltransferase